MSEEASSDEDVEDEVVEREAAESANHSTIMALLTEIHGKMEKMVQ